MLTREAILSMPAGPKLDKAVHETVMGVDLEGFHWPRTGSYGKRHEMFKEEPSRVTWIEFPKYSTDIAAAWEVIEQMKRTQDVRMWADLNGKWACEIGYLVEDDCDTASEAICRAALLSLLKED